MKREKIRTLIFPFIICAAVLSVLSCAPKTRVAVNQLDTPERHTFTGLKLLDQEKYTDAHREFKMAIQLNDNYSRAYTGMALVDTFTNKYGTALDNLTLGSKYAKSDEDKLFVNIGRIQYYTISKSDPKWLELAKNQFDEAVAIDSKHTSAYYYMGLAYKEALEFNLAGLMFSRVIQLKTDHIADADAQLKFLQKVQLAIPSTETGFCLAGLCRAMHANLVYTRHSELADILRPRADCRWTLCLCRRGRSRQEHGQREGGVALDVTSGKPIWQTPVGAISPMISGSRA